MNMKKSIATGIGALVIGAIGFGAGYHLAPNSKTVNRLQAEADSNWSKFVEMIDIHQEFLSRMPNYNKCLPNKYDNIWELGLRITHDKEWESCMIQDMKEHYKP